MTPTDAQIEAARLVIKAWEGSGAPIQWPFADALANLREALTAAAEVGTEYRVCERCKLWVYKPLVHPPECIEAIDASSPPPFDAAAEGMPHITWETLDRLEKKLERIEAETIERCAQVAEEKLREHAGNYGCGPYTRAAIKSVIAAIRRLKD